MLRISWSVQSQRYYPSLHSVKIRKRKLTDATAPQKFN
jgi:hypothetical protein